MNEVEILSLESMSKEEARHQMLQAFEAQSSSGPARFIDFTEAAEGIAEDAWTLLFSLHELHEAYRGGNRVLASAVWSTIDVTHAYRAFDAAEATLDLVDKRLDLDAAHLQAIKALASDFRDAMKDALASELHQYSGDDESIRTGFVVRYHDIDDAVERIDEAIEATESIVRVARSTVINYLEYCTTYELVQRSVNVLSGTDDILAACFDQIGVRIEIAIDEARSSVGVSALAGVTRNASEAAKLFRKR